MASSSARVAGEGGWSVGAVLGHSVRPLVVAPETLTDAPYPGSGRIVTSRTIAALAVAYGISEFLELGLVAPLVVSQEGEAASGLADPHALDGGLGLTDAPGTPDWRAFAGVALGSEVVGPEPRAPGDG